MLCSQTTWLECCSSAGITGGQLVCKTQLGLWLFREAQAPANPANSLPLQKTGLWSLLVSISCLQRLPECWWIEVRIGTLGSGAQEGKTWGRSIYYLLKVIQSCSQKQAHFFPTYETHFLWITPTHKLKSWIIAGFIYMCSLALIYDMVCLGVNSISFSFQQCRVLQLNKINNLFRF